MFLGFLFVFIFVTSRALHGAVVSEENTKACSLDEFACTDGACVSSDHVCDGLKHCSDGSDEADCYSSHNDILGHPVITRQKRQAACGKAKWQCRDGSCISFDGKCDGVVDCPDGSDETHALCRKIKCQSNWFRCTYGACVDGAAPCNGAQECADNSDELLPRCRNETMEIRGKFRCANGDSIPASNHCDGVKDCADGSDETVRACAAKTCPGYLFQCAYGACVDAGADCNNVIDCADSSDEDDELCNRSGGSSPGVTIAPPTGTGNCVLPPYPSHGRYSVGGAPNATPGQRFSTVQLNVTCSPGYGVDGESSVYCFDGSWSAKTFPQCVRYCKLNKHPSVEYRCLIGGNSIDGSRPCNSQEPAGTIVRPECNTPNYHYPGVLNYMRCIDGSWDYVAICTPGLSKKGTNITILVKDRVEVHVSEFEYQVPLFDVPVTKNLVDDDDDDEVDMDFKVGVENNSTSVNVRISNGSVSLKNKDKITFFGRNGRKYQSK